MSSSCSDANCAAPAADLSSLVRPPLWPRTDREALDLIECLTMHADQVQTHTLAAILETNAHTEYLRKYGLEPGVRSDAQSFRSLVPVITYEDLLPEIQRIANGDNSPILTAEPLSQFFTSSGTLGGELKLIPTTHHHNAGAFLLGSLVRPIINQYVPDLEKGKGMYLWFLRSEVMTPGGLLARPVLSSFFMSNWFLQGYNRKHLYTSPIETVLCTYSFQSMYCQLLCGLLQRADVLHMGSSFASTFLRAVRFFQDHWRQLCNDIRTGNLSDVITDEPARKAVCQLLSEAACSSQQREDLAEFITQTCAGCEERGSWMGIIPLVWPRTKFISVVVTGAMAQYIPTLDMYSGGLPLVSTLYASSECFFGLNLQPMCKPSEVSYTLLPNMAYFEFLPVYGRAGSCGSGTKRMAAQKQDDQQLVELVDVQVGCQYELVVTTFAGLYRYRMGDIVCVTGFHNKAPQFKFVCRENVALSIDTDKTGEDMLHRAIMEATSKNLHQTSVALVDYTSCVDLSTIPGHYVLFWELQHSSKISAARNASDREQIEIGISR